MKSRKPRLPYFVSHYMLNVNVFLTLTIFWIKVILTENFSCFSIRTCIQGLNPILFVAWIYSICALLILGLTKCCQESSSTRNWKFDFFLLCRNGTDKNYNFLLGACIVFNVTSFKMVTHKFTDSAKVSFKALLYN